MRVPVYGERGLPSSLYKALAQELVLIFCLWLGKEHRLIAEDIGKSGWEDGMGPHFWVGTEPNKVREGCVRRLCHSCLMRKQSRCLENGI